MKKIYSIGYNDSSNDFIKVWENGSTRKFETIEEATKFIYEYLIKRNSERINLSKPIKIMQGWKVIKEINVII